MDETDIERKQKPGKRRKKEGGQQEAATNHATITKLRYQLTKNARLEGSEAAQGLFKELRDQSISASESQSADRAYTQDTDVSVSGLGVTPSPEEDGRERMVSSCSESLSAAEPNHSITHKELFGTVKA